MHTDIDTLVKEKLFGGLKKVIVSRHKERFCKTQEYQLSQTKHELLNQKYKEWYRNLSNFYLSFNSIFALKFLVDRELKIEAHEAQEILKITVEYSYDDIDFYASYPVQFTIDMQKEIEDCMTELKDPLYAHIVDNFKEVKDTERSPHPPLTNAQLKYSNFYLFRFSPTYTTQLASMLMSAGLITDIHTNGWNIDNSVIEDIITMLNGFYGEEKVLQSKRKFTDKSASREQECIRPVKILSSYYPKNIQETQEFKSIPFQNKSQADDALKLYSFIFYTTAATQMKNSIYDTSSLEIVAGNRRLLAQSNIVLEGEENWELLTGNYIKKITSNSDSFQKQTTVIPDIEPGVELNCDGKVKLVSFMSKKPPRYGIGRFITQILEKYNIGNYDTFDQIIEDLITSRAVLNIRNMLHPQQNSIILFEWLQEYLPSFLNIEFMYEVNEKISDAKEGIISMQSVVEEIDEMISEAFENAGIALDSIAPSEAKINLLRKIIKKNNLTININDYVNSEVKIDMLLAQYPTDEPVKVGKCPKCNFSVFQKEYIDGKTGEVSVYYMCEKYDKNNGCNFVIWDSTIYKFFSSKEMELYTVDDRKEVFKKILPLKRGYFFSGFIAKNKKSYDAKVYLAEYKDAGGRVKWGFKMKFQKKA